MRTPGLLVGGGIAVVVIAGCGSSGSTTSGGSGGGGGGGGDYCAAAKAVRDSQSEINALGTATAIADERSAIADLVGKVDAAASVAPSDVSADWATVRVFFDLASSAVQSATDTAGAASNVEALQTNSAAAAASASLDAAGKRIDAYTQTHCGFAISTPTPGVSTGSQTSSSAASST